MALNLSKLEKLVRLGNGAMRARCPACAEGGQDRTGEHLRITPDGRFGCCVHPKDREHRKKIFALVGESQRTEARRIKVRVGSVSSGDVQTGIFGRLGRVFASQTTVSQASDASDGEREEQPLLFEARTARTGETKSSSDQPEEAISVNPISANSAQYNKEVNSRTPRTPFQNSRVYPEEDSLKSNNICDTLKEFADPVRGVREVESGERLPFITPKGDLVIPFESPERYHWWKSGQSIAQTKREILERN